MYAEPKATASPDVIAGKEAYKAFTKTILLDENMRAQGTTPEARKFRGVLGELRNGLISTDNWEFLKTRLESGLSIAERGSFADTLYLYSTKIAVQAYNEKRLRALGKPVIKIHADNSALEFKKVDSDDAGHLENELLLSKDVRVMLTYNLSVSQGLVNGTIGTVSQIL